MRIKILILLLLLTASPVLAQEDSEDEDDNIQIKVDSILALVKPDSPDSSKMFWYYQIGVIADNSDTAIKYAQLSLELCKDGDAKFIGDNYYNIGVSYFMQDRSSEALKYFFKAEPYYEKLSQKNKIADNNIAIGKCYHDLNLNDSSLTHLGRALEL
ncbi:MAG: tetratricopeptide repeat protein, partial [Bacteroidales bacterium]|nr:tetratricopeptide repeat protein [Bacteroidales bacterium]